MSQEKGFDDKASWGVAQVLLSGQAMGMAAYSRTCFGGEYVGIQGIAGFVVLMIWVGITHSAQLEALILPFLFMIFLHKYRHFIDYRKGIVRHSRYVGDTWLAGWMCRDQRNARIIEGIIWAAFGGWLAENIAYRYLGNYIGMSGISIILLECIMRYTDGKKETAMRDAQIEMSHLAERLQRNCQF